MQAFLVLLLAAVASSQVVYPYGSHHQYNYMPYTAQHHYPAAVSTYHHQPAAAVVHHAAKPVTYVKPAVAVHHAVKPVTYVKPAVAAVPAVLPKYHANSAGVQHTVYKREAEAEAEPNHHFGFYSAPVHHAAAYTPYVAHRPVVYAAPHHFQAGTYANDAVSPFHYAAKGRYYANSAGTVHKAKREAEPYYGYYGNNYYNNYPTAYSYSAYNSYPASTYSYGYNRYPYSYYY